MKQAVRLTETEVRSGHTVNTLTPYSDQHLVSPYNISPESNVKVMRIKDMI